MSAPLGVTFFLDPGFNENNSGIPEFESCPWRGFQGGNSGIRYLLTKLLGSRDSRDARAEISEKIGRDPWLRYLREVKEVTGRRLNDISDEIHPL